MMRAVIDEIERRLLKAEPGAWVDCDRDSLAAAAGIDRSNVRHVLLRLVARNIIEVRKLPPTGDVIERGGRQFAKQGVKQCRAITPDMFTERLRRESAKLREVGRAAASSGDQNVAAVDGAARDDLVLAVEQHAHDVVVGEQEVRAYVRPVNDS
jgi:DNA-binding GntR family transcriptional regulator